MKCTCGHPESYNYVIDNGLCDMCIEAELERLREETRWIPVGERLPESGQYKGLSERVHCLNLHTETFMVDRWDIDKQRWASGNTSHTHWRPIILPEGD